MPINATDPIVVPAKPEMIFDRWVITSMFISGSGIEKPASLSVTFVPAHLDVDGVTWTLKPSIRSTMIIPDLYAEAATNPDIAAAMNAVITAVVTKATITGKI